VVRLVSIIRIDKTEIRKNQDRLLRC